VPPGAGGAPLSQNDTIMLVFDGNGGLHGSAMGLCTIAYNANGPVSHDNTFRVGSMEHCGGALQAIWREDRPNVATVWILGLLHGE